MSTLRLIFDYLRHKHLQDSSRMIQMRLSLLNTHCTSGACRWTTWGHGQFVRTFCPWKDSARLLGIDHTDAAK